MELESSLFSSKLKNGYITCLKFVDSYIFAGQSGNLLIFRVGHEPTYKSDLIKCLEVFPSQNIYGIVARQSKIIVFGGKSIALLTGENPKSLSIKRATTVEDWIFDCMWSDDSSVLLLTAHNVLLKFNIDDSFTSSERVCCDERCILYSGKIFGTNADDIIIFAGTVYQEVILWVPSYRAENGSSPVLHRLEGHKGVIFSTTYDSKSQCIASTSDDRTVRLWKVKFPETPENLNFGEFWAKANIELSFTAYGHTARVWKCVIVSEELLLTLGEDSFICLWDKEGTLINRWEHPGEIWTADYREGYLAVGGNGVTLRALFCSPEISSLSLREFGDPKRVLLSSFNTPVIVTDKGNLLLSLNNEVADAYLDNKFYSYCLLSISKSRSQIALGGINGDVVLHRVLKNKFSKLCEANIGCGRVFSLAWESEEKLVVCGENGHLTFFKITTNEDGCSMEPTHFFVLPASKERWFNCVLILDDFFICGDRMGSLFLYSMTSDNKEPIDKCVRLHGVKGVSDLKFINNKLYTCGRDGFIKELEIVDDKLSLIASCKLPMDWASSICETKIHGLLIAGFHDVNFVLWSLKERITLLVLDCGGGHRSFDYVLDESTNNLVLSYIRMKEVKCMSYSFNKLSHQTVLKSYHVRSINAATFISGEGDKSLVLTGGEDNSLRMCLIDGNSWDCCGTYVRHISAIRAIKYFDDLVISAGARAQLVVWTITGSKGVWSLKEAGSHMIRDEKENHRSWREALPLTDPETRYMDLEIFKDGNEISIFGACSDGIFRVFSYLHDTKRLDLVSSVESDQSCLLKAISFLWKKKLVLITGGTRGTVAFWHPPFASKPPRCHQIHSLGINAMDCFVSGDRLILASGCDDSSIALTLFSLDSNKESIIFSVTEYMHSCQVSGIKITSDFIISASIDQRVCVLKWQLNGSFLKTLFVGCYMTSVPDIHGISVWPLTESDTSNFNIFVYGCGFQLVQFKHPDKSRQIS